MAGTASTAEPAESSPSEPFRNGGLVGECHRVDDLLTQAVRSFVALVASGRATDWPDGIRAHGRSPAFTAY